MTLLSLRNDVLQKVDENPASPAFYTAARVDAALNSAQRLFCLLSLCLEGTATLTLAADTPFQHILAQVSDFLVPLRLRIGGAKILPGTPDDFAAIHHEWYGARGTPAYYAVLGVDLLGTHPTVESETSADLTYAKSPAVMSGDSATPEIPEQYQPQLVHGAVFFLRLTEGGQELSTALEGMKEFLESAAACGDLVRRRNRAARYDRVPPEIRLSDLSRLLQ